MKAKLTKCLCAMLGVACLGTSLMFTPVATKTVSAAAPEISEPDQNYTEWIYWVDEYNKKLYKRLMNTSTGDWIGPWIFVRDLEDWEIDILLGRG